MNLFNEEGKILSFEEAVKRYPLLHEIEKGMRVLALPESDYAGLYGVVTDVRKQPDFESENETVLEIEVDFEEPEFSDVRKTHPHLNGTSIDMVICGEEELAFQFQHEDVFMTIEGKILCECCMTLADVMTQKVEANRSFVWDEQRQKYKMEVVMGAELVSCTVCQNNIHGWSKEPPITLLKDSKEEISLNAEDVMTIKTVLEELRLYRSDDNEEREMTSDGLYEDEHELIKKLDIELG